MIACIQRVILPLLGMVPLVLPVQAGSNLLENSPFLPPNISTGAAQESTPLELRSVLKAGGEYEFSLYDPAKKQSTWARLNEPGHDFVIKAFDPAKDTVTVELRNRTFKLTLKEAKITLLSPASGQPSATPAAGAQPVVSRGPTGPPAPGPVPELTPEQLRNLQADINRRRELRRQATASPGQTAPAQPPQSR